ncbi:Protein turtle-like A, partial [Ophiophagus hannah]
MNVDGDWPPEENEKEDGLSGETVVHEPTLLGSPRRSFVPDQDRPASPIYMDMEADSSSVQDQLAETSFLQLPDPDTGPPKTPLPGSLACPQYLCSRTESPPPKDQGWLWTLPSSSPSSQPLPDCPQAELSCLGLPLPELPPEKHTSPAANFPQALPLEKFLRGSLTSQSSGRGSASFLRPPSLATSVAGSYLSSPFGEAASCRSSSVGEENRSKKENLAAVLEKSSSTEFRKVFLRNISLLSRSCTIPQIIGLEKRQQFTPYTVAPELSVLISASSGVVVCERNLLQFPFEFGSDAKHGPGCVLGGIEDLWNGEKGEKSFRDSTESSRTSPTNSQSVGALDGSSSPLPLASPEERCAALREEFLAYRRRREMIQQRRQKRDPGGEDERFEQATLF